MTIDTKPVLSEDRQRRLIQALQNPALYPHPVEAVTLLETHISYVLLTGRFVYKIKKSVNLGFLDFSSLEQRRFYCEEELRLNRRLTPELYLAVVPINGTPDEPQLGDGNIPPECDGHIEYAVKMLEFPQAALLDRRLSTGTLLPEEIDALAERIAEVHAQIVRTGPGDDYGLPTGVWTPMAQNFSQLKQGPNTPLDTALLDTLGSWSRDEYTRLKTLLAARQRNGFVRECHGDLHLGNIALLHGKPQLFDCIEFSPDLRWIDVMNEVAFLIIDLEEKGHPGYAYRFLNHYLENTGDYAGLRVLPFYLVYRALVRAKVAGIRATQEDAQAAREQMAIRSQYLVCARRASLPGKPQLLLMHGVAGSGKTWVAQAILERIGALRLRSDVERKRLCGLSSLARSDSAIDRGLYDAETTRATYQRLAQLAQEILQAGFPVVVDGANLKSWQRQIFRSLAETLHVPFKIISCRAEDAMLHRRLTKRQQTGTDASEAGIAILRHQLQNTEPLSAAEQQEAIPFDSSYDSLDIIFRQLGQQTPG